METLKWLRRLIVWPFIIILEIFNEEDLSERYAIGAGLLAMSGLIIPCGFFSFARILHLEGANALTWVLIFIGALFYFLIGIAFYFDKDFRNINYGPWQRQGPW